MRVVWLVYGSLDQATGGYVYDRLVVAGLRALGDDVRLMDPRAPHAGRDEQDVLVGDALCAGELGPLFEGWAGVARLLLVHHLPSWELERGDHDELRALESRAMGASNVVIATGASTADRLAVEFPGRRVEVVVPGADRLPVMASGGNGDGAPLRVLFIGSLIPRKRVAWLLDALESLPEGRVTLTLVGDASRDPGHAATLLARIEASARLRAQVRVAGVLDERSLAHELARADVLALPSSLEGYGMVMTEALHAGVPVVASHQAASAASLAGHEAIETFREQAELVSILQELLEDSHRRETLRRAARDWPAPRWSDAVEAFRSALTRAVADRGATRPANGRSR